MVAGASNESRLVKTLRHGGGWTAIGLNGIIDERSGLDQLTASVAPGRVIVFTRQVARINSVGVRDWVNWLKALRDSDHQIVLVDCSPALMDQVNLVRNFAQETWVDSFMAPYFCDRCDLEQDERLDTAELLQISVKNAPESSCGKSACGLTFDDVEESYFAFLADQELPSDLTALRADVAAARQALERAEETGSARRPPSGPQARVPLRAGLATEPNPIVPDVAPPMALPPRQPLAEFLFLGVLAVLGGLLGLLIYLMLTLE